MLQIEKHSGTTHTHSTEFNGRVQSVRWEYTTPPMMIMNHIIISYVCPSFYLYLFHLAICFDCSRYVVSIVKCTVCHDKYDPDFVAMVAVFVVVVIFRWFLFTSSTMHQDWRSWQLFHWRRTETETTTTIKILNKLRHLYAIMRIINMLTKERSYMPMSERGVCMRVRAQCLQVNQLVINKSHLIVQCIEIKRQLYVSMQWVCTCKTRLHPRANILTRFFFSTHATVT